jgi:glycosyltransferase involved in cell wall biosynthesis
MFDALIGRLASPWNASVHVERPRKMRGRCPLVSVVIPCYNYGLYLPECVKSVLDQPNIQVDVLIIDDASSDGSAEVVSRVAAQDSRIRAIYHDTNRGHIATYNEGLAQARGDYAVLLSADDLLTPGCLYRATALMEAHPSVGLTYGFSLDLRDGELPPARTIAGSWIIWPGHKWIAHRCKTGQNALRSPEAVMRTKILRQVGGYHADLPHSGDFEMWMRAASVSDIGFVGGADQAYYRIHSNNMHHSRFDSYADLSGRLRAFDHILDERSELLTGANMMREAAHRALAREALGYAISAYTRGVADRKLIDDYAAFALHAWPDAWNLREWRALSRLRRMPASLPHRDLSLIRREAIRNLRYALGWRRQRWAGIGY